MPGTMTPYLCIKYDENSPGGTSRKIGCGCAARFLKPLPYFRPKSVFFLPYFRPDQIFDTLFQTWSPEARRVTGARDKLLRHVHGVSIKKEMVLSPNDKEVASSRSRSAPASSKQHTQFKTRVHKPYPVSDQNVRNWYPMSDQNR